MERGKALRRSTAVAGLAVWFGGTYALIHRRLNQPAPKPRCEAVNFRNKDVRISSYPLGKTAVSYEEKKPIGRDESETTGTIAKRTGGYVLRVKGLPPVDHLTNADTSLSHTHALVSIDVPHAGEIGLTGPCIEQPPAGAATEVSVVKLPTH